MKPTTIHGFFQAVKARTKNMGERQGQAAFNILLECKPLLAESIRETELDPFHASTDGQTWRDFTAFISAFWEEEDRPYQIPTDVL